MPKDFQVEGGLFLPGYFQVYTRKALGCSALGTLVLHLPQGDDRQKIENPIDTWVKLVHLENGKNKQTYTTQKTDTKPGESAEQKKEGFAKELQLKMCTAFTLFSVILLVESVLLLLTRATCGSTKGPRRDAGLF